MCLREIWTGFRRQVFRGPFGPLDCRFESAISARIESVALVTRRRHATAFLCAVVWTIRTLFVYLVELFIEDHLINESKSIRVVNFTDLFPKWGVRGWLLSLISTINALIWEKYKNETSLWVKLIFYNINIQFYFYTLLNPIIYINIKNKSYKKTTPILVFNF